MKESTEQKIKSAEKCTEKFFEDARSLMASILSKEQETLVKKIIKTDEILKKHWENDFEKIRKETLAQHCFDLFQCLEMMLVNIDKAEALRKSYDQFLIAGNELRPHLN